MITKGAIAGNGKSPSAGTPELNPHPFVDGYVQFNPHAPAGRENLNAPYNNGIVESNFDYNTNRTQTSLCKLLISQKSKKNFCCGSPLDGGAA